ncbi:MAG: hypothetical protein ACK4UP_02400 [Spirosomataceae bacterium]
MNDSYDFLSKPEEDFRFYEVDLTKGDSKLGEVSGSAISGSDASLKPTRDVAGGISNILDNLSKVLFGVSSIKNGQDAQIPPDALFTNRQVELNQPVQRNNSLLFIGLSIVLIIVLILLFNKK